MVTEGGRTRITHAVVEKYTSGVAAQFKASRAMLPKDIKRMILDGPGQGAAASKDGTARRRTAHDSSPHHAHTDPMANAPKRRRLSPLSESALDIACPLHAVVRFNKGKSKAFMNGAKSWIKISAPETPAEDPEGCRTHLQDIRRYMSGRSHPPTQILRSVLQKILASCAPAPPECCGPWPCRRVPRMPQHVCPPPTTPRARVDGCASAHVVLWRLLR